MATLPRPDVSVATTSDESGSNHTAITVSRDGRQRTWSGASATANGATVEAVKKMLDDPMTAEYVKESR